MRSSVCLVLLTMCVPALAQDVRELATFSPQQIEFFETSIRPLLIEHCYDCHSTDAKEVEADLYVDSREGLTKGGDSGAAIVVGKPDESLLIAAVRYESGEMPPDRKLPDRQVELLTKWVEMGAPWPAVTSSPGTPVARKVDWNQFDWDAARSKHWAWKPILPPSIPDGDAADPIDRFVSRQRSEAGLVSVGQASASILARRLYFDLIGIPPSPGRVDAFVKAASKDTSQAVAELVDELLASPMYGQRWARHWLDVARYSDGHGGFLDNQALDDAWRYRDWVVDAFNADMPIDQFLRLQIAGDLTGDPRDAIATGFFALGPTYRSDGGDPDSVAQAKGETLDDRIDTLTRGLLGITGSCARCHDHKFDPIPQQDYYSLAGIFNNTSVHRRPLAADDVVKRFNDHKKLVTDIEKKIKDFRKQLKNESREGNEEEKARLKTWESELEQARAQSPPGFDTTHALHESGSGDMKVALRGNLRKTGDVAPRRFPRILSGKTPDHFTDGSGRADLADAIVAAENPLTARVFVNRVWMHHFGDGLVRTPSNFGSLGESPTHPDLLDWLAGQFIADGWSLKSLHRKILNSETYRQSSRYDESSFRIDGDNRMMWRMSPRRMDIEVWRDSLLQVTDQLETTAGGQPFTDVLKSRRRTLYAKVSRNGDVFASDAFLRRFDFPLMRATVARRPKSIVPQQYLFLLNSSFMVDRAKALVARLDQQSSVDQERIRLAYQWLFQRDPDETERNIGIEFLGSAKGDQKIDPWTRYSQVLLSSNEFMFVR